MRAWQEGTGKLNNRMLQELRTLAGMANVMIRPNALCFGDPAPRVGGLSAGLTAGHAATNQCAAYRQGGNCDDCRTCWDSDVEIRIGATEAR
jgi:hypothetical protein